MICLPLIWLSFKPPERLRSTADSFKAKNGLMTKDTALAIKNVSCVPRKSSGSAFPQFALTLRPMCNYLNENFFLKEKWFPKDWLTTYCPAEPGIALRKRKIFHLLWKMPLNENKVFHFSWTDFWRKSVFHPPDPHTHEMNSLPMIW